MCRLLLLSVGWLLFVGPVPLRAQEDKAKRVDTLLVLGRSVFRDIDCASFNISILHRSFESRFIDDAYSSYEDGSFLLVAVHLLPLTRCPQQRVGVVIYKGKKAQ